MCRSEKLRQTLTRLCNNRNVQPLNDGSSKLGSSPLELGDFKAPSHSNPSSWDSNNSRNIKIRPLAWYVYAFNSIGVNFAGTNDVHVTPNWETHMISSVIATSWPYTQYLFPNIFDASTLLFNSKVEYRACCTVKGEAEGSKLQIPARVVCSCCALLATMSGLHRLHNVYNYR